MLALVEGVVPRRLGVTTKVNRLALDGKALTEMRSKDSPGILWFLPGFIPAEKEVDKASPDHAYLVDERGQIEEKHATDEDEHGAAEILLRPGEQLLV